MPAKSTKYDTAIDATDYTEVLITKTGAVDDHVYRRGTTHMVDANTLKALKAAGLVESAS